MGGAVKSSISRITDAAQQVVSGAGKAANTLVGNKTAEAAAPAPATPVAPASLDDGTAAAVLDEAESIINAVFGEVVADMNDKRKNKKKNRDKKKKK
jgi:hypothetical protein